MICRAARYWRVAPWDLLEQRALWTDLAITLMSAEAQVEESRRKRSKRRSKRGGHSR